MLTWITIPADFATSMQAYVGNVFTDLTVPILLVIGLPLAFWFVSKVIALVRGGFRTAGGGRRAT